MIPSGTSLGNQSTLHGSELIYVDLDNTVLRTDSLWESLAIAIKHNPLLGLAIPFWLLQGKASFKQRIAQKTRLNPADLLYHEGVVEFLRLKKSEGRKLILATAAAHETARPIADHLGLFSAILASDGRVNLSAEAKRTAIKLHASGRVFEYIGDSTQDLPVWKEAAIAHVVSSDPRFIRRVARQTALGLVFPSQKTTLKAILRTLRIKQWIKNILLFSPLLLSHRIGNYAAVQASILAFLSFSLCASSVYILNDLLDLASDRHHPEKQSRPLAAGALSIPAGLWLAGLCLITSIAVSAVFLPWTFLLVLAGYIILNQGYTLLFKRVIIIDVLLLTLFYVYRIIAGSIATGIPITQWLLIFTAFFFLGLALVKRYGELRLIEQHISQKAISARGYTFEDMGILRTIGVNCSFLAVLTLALYINSPDILPLYPHPLLLWGVVPCLVYWVARLWLLAERGIIHDDPLIFTMRDKISYATGAIVFVILAIASLPL